MALQRNQLRILQLLQKNPIEWEMGEIREQANFLIENPYRVINRILSDLIKLELVEKTERGVYKITSKGEYYESDPIIVNQNLLETYRDFKVGDIVTYQISPLEIRKGEIELIRKEDINVIAKVKWLLRKNPQSDWRYFGKNWRNWLSIDKLTKI